MLDCDYFLLYLTLGKLSLMLLINYYQHNHYHEKNIEANKPKCSYDFDYILKYVWCKKYFAFTIIS